MRASSQDFRSEVGVRASCRVLMARSIFFATGTQKSPFFLYKTQIKRYNGCMLKICAVPRGSIGEQLHLKKGDEILSFDGYRAVDEMDYLYADSLSSFTMELRRGEETFFVSVEKDESESLELEIETEQTIRTCHNHCIFCFVDQMPKGMRESLYVKDDDYAMSFACGNFVTLTNLSDEELERIIRLKLSPLYVSVHTMNPDLRCALLRNRFAGKIVEQVDKLCKGGITLHTQAVIVPGRNDFDDLGETARKLFSYYPQVKDLAVVPTGITMYREGLTQIPDVDGAYSAKFLDFVDSLNLEFGVDFVLAADEYYVKAGRAFKPASFYGEFEQIENGIGMTTKFTSEFYESLSECALPKKKRSVTICGVSAATVLEPLLASANEKIHGLEAELLPVKNTFFGETVTCTGLLVGRDIYDALVPYVKKVDEIILPGNTMKEFEDVFLDGMTLKELKKQLKFKNIRVNRGGGFGYVKLLSTLK